jgi:hypothetical protein
MANFADSASGFLPWERSLAWQFLIWICKLQLGAHV